MRNSQRNLLDRHLFAIHVAKSDMRLGVVACEHPFVVDEHTRSNVRSVVRRLPIAHNDKRQELLLLVLETKAQLAFIYGLLRIFIEALNREDPKSRSLRFCLFGLCCRL